MVVANAFSPSTLGAEAGSSLNSNPAWWIGWVIEQSGATEKPLSGKTNKQKRNLRGEKSQYWGKDRQMDLGTHCLASLVKWWAPGLSESLPPENRLYDSWGTRRAELWASLGYTYMRIFRNIHTCTCTHKHIPTYKKIQFLRYASQLVGGQ